MDTTKDTTMRHVTDVTIVPEATAEFIAGLLERIEQLESDIATAEQDSRQKQARIERLEQAVQDHHANAMCKGCDHSHPLTQLRLAAYQQSKLYAETVFALEESK